MTELDTAPRVWVGCLACYNNGRLVGEWVDATAAEDYVPCRRSDFGAPHEEWWVMDHEYFDGLLTGECSPMEATRLAGLIDHIEDDGRVPVIAFAEWCSNQHIDSPTEDDYAAAADKHQGVFESREDWAWHALDDQLDGLPEWMENYQGEVVRAWLHNVEQGGEMEFIEVPVVDSWATNVAVFTA